MEHAAAVQHARVRVRVINIERMKKNLLEAFSLIEVLVFVSILSIFFIGAAAIATAALRDMKITEHKIIATRYAEELLEWLRAEKETDWNVFADSGHAGKCQPAQTLCFNTLDWNSGCSVSCAKGLNSLYGRSAKFQVDNPALPTQVTVSLEVSWTELGNTYTIPIKTNFAIWEQ